MIKTFQFFCGFLLIVACADKEQKQPKNKVEVTQIEKKENPLIKLKSDFKFTNLTNFEIDSFNWETRPGNYKELNAETFKLIFQDSRRKFIGRENDRDYLFSWQSKRTDLTELVILTQDESSYCDLLQYCIFDKNGIAIDSFIIAAQCGDGGWSYNSFGKKIAENKFEVKSVEYDSELTNSPDSEIIEGDSNKIHFTISPEGKVFKKEVSKIHFRKEL